MTITEYLVNIALILVVLRQVRGRHLTVRSFVIPIGISVWIGSQYLKAVPTAGNDLVLAAVGLAAGCVLGALAACFTTVTRGGDGVAFARAGVLGGSFWVFGIGARLAFALFATYGGEAVIARFSIASHITSSQAWVTAFILMAIAEAATRLTAIYFKTRRIGAEIGHGRPTRSLAAA